MSNFPRDPVLTHPICSRGNLAAVELQTSRGGGEADDGASWNWRGSEGGGEGGATKVVFSGTKVTTKKPSATETPAAARATFL